MPGAEEIRFDSWKEIATYLGRDHKTAQRWEQRRGLPVHRFPGGGRAAVYALKSEIDAWMQQTGTIVGTLDSTHIVVPEETSRKPYYLRPHILTAAALVIVGVVLFAFSKISNDGGEAATTSFAGSQLLAWNNGKVVWSYNFGQPLRDLSPDALAAKVQFLDLYGDGRKFVIVAAPLLREEDGNNSTDTIYCFSPRGTLLWKHVFDDHFHFGGEDAGPRWDISAMLATGKGTKRTLWITISSFPTSVCLLLKIGPDGTVTRRFANYGHLRSLGEVETPGGAYLLAGGINNEYNTGTLAVLKEDEPSGRSPQTGALFDCESCPAGRPLRYFLFPRSEVDRAIGPPYNQVFAILATNGRIQAMTMETVSPPPLPSDWVMYNISEKFVPEAATFSDNYSLVHERLIKEGKIHHSLDACPERVKSITVREWDPQGGWTNVALPPIAHKRK
jgi:hypothetical protein